jgi:hypothetical protein
MINSLALCLLRPLPPCLDLRHDIILFLFLLFQMGAGYELCFLFGFDAILILQRLFFQSRRFWADGFFKKKKKKNKNQLGLGVPLAFSILFHYFCFFLVCFECHPRRREGVITSYEVSCLSNPPWPRWSSYYVSYFFASGLALSVGILMTPVHGFMYVNLPALDVVIYEDRASYRKPISHNNCSYRLPLLCVPGQTGLGFLCN